MMVLTFLDVIGRKLLAHSITGPEIYALPLGMAALQSGSYFVAASDNDSVLDRVCRIAGYVASRACSG